MKTKPFVFQGALLLLSFVARGQSQLLYDQESVNLVEGSAPIRQAFQPVGQSFIPTFSSIGFVELNLFYSDSLNHAGATVAVNIRTASITGTILGSSSDVFIPDDFFGTTNFLFSTPIPLIPGITYYLQPTIISGGNVSSFVTDGSYPGGTLIFQGTPIPDRDLWFREGVIPEPSSGVLFLIGGCVVFWRRRGGLADMHRRSNQ